MNREPCRKPPEWGGSGPNLSRRRNGVHDPHVQVVPFAPHLVPGDAGAGIVDAAAGGDVVLPQVPRAENARADDRALSEGSPAMNADPMDRMELAAEIEQGDRNASGVHGHAGASGDVSRPGDL